ncbi:FIST signal transduction protein [Massilia sp. H6]|uniref:FIST signal transduction protein n=1 Tax=Massilia sp. H6 TaxID=2970464 RepID=UPI00216A2A1F|nr:FIST N-terminal domain-containing protein [Massilia sp. H6]UVW29274.1 FIST C-terminal domain-containing protein [Massilia sp. H6]
MPQNQVAVSHTVLRNEADAGSFLASEVVKKLGGHSPDVVIVFASPEFDYRALLQAIEYGCKPGIMVGCSSAGEFSGCDDSNASASLMAIRGEDIRFNAALGKGVSVDPMAALDQIMPVFTGAQHGDFPYRCALVLTDALAGYTDDMIHEMTVRTGGMYQLFGGGAADDARFQQTHVFMGSSVHDDAVVVLEMLSKRPIGLGVRHGWEPASEPLRVTESDGNRVISLNAIPAGDVFADHAERTGQVFRRDDPLPFFLHNVIGIDTGDGFKLRVPLSLGEDGSVSCAAAVPVGATVHLMVATASSASEAASQASQAALGGLRGGRHAGSLLFDCAATRLRLGRAFGDELKAVAETLGSDNFAGCNTYGQIARAEGQFSGFHNCTAIVCAIPE